MAEIVDPVSKRALNRVVCTYTGIEHFSLKEIKTSTESVSCPSQNLF